MASAQSRRLVLSGRPTRSDRDSLPPPGDPSGQAHDDGGVLMTDIINRVRELANKGWGPEDPFLSIDDQTFVALLGQKAAYINALTYIADEATVEDFAMIQYLANIALGREWNADRTPVKS